MKRSVILSDQYAKWSSGGRETFAESLKVFCSKNEKKAAWKCSPGHPECTLTNLPANFRQKTHSLKFWKSEKIIIIFPKKHSFHKMFLWSQSSLTILSKAFRQNWIYFFLIMPKCWRACKFLKKNLKIVPWTCWWQFC